jgi:ABC-type lipoprotein release transport system permease subunit
MFERSLKTGLFLSIRQIRRASLWTNILIIFVMTLTFLNLVVVSGILVGLIEGSSNAFREQYSGDILLTNLKNKDYISNTPIIIKNIESIPEVRSITTRYTAGGRAEANYKNKTNLNDKSNSVGVQMVGINPADEDKTTDLSKFIVEGSYFDGNDESSVLVGSSLLKKYSRVVTPSLELLENVSVGSKIRVSIGNYQKEVTVKGVIKSKIQSTSNRIFFTDDELRKILYRSDYGANEIAVKLIPGADPLIIESLLKADGFEKFSNIDTWEEAQGQFYKDLGSTFVILSNMIGSIGLTVASITVFIVIFINAITRRKFIGILKGIGISSTALEISYVFQSLFYAFIGSGLGLLLLFGFLKPYIDLHPIDFPFSDGILVATFSGTSIRVGLLFVITMIAGYIPARIVTKQNTLDSILGR